MIPVQNPINRFKLLCDPTTLLVLSGTASAVGGVVKAQGEAASLEYQSEVAKNEARIANIEAEDAALRGAQRALRLRNLASKELSESISATAASGIAVESGTAAEVSESVKLIGAADVLDSQRNTKREVWGFRTKTAQKISEAKQLRRAAKTTRLLSPFTDIAPILGTFGQIGAISAARNTGGQK